MEPPCPAGHGKRQATASLNRLNFQHLQYLQALVEERHVTRAAERMGIGQPAMSTALARLREVFKDVLLVKTTHGHGAHASRAGTGQPCAGNHGHAGGARIRGRTVRSGDLTGTLAHHGLGWHLPHSAAGDDGTLVMREAPRMRFTVQPGDPRRLSEYLRDGDFDLALSFVRSPPSELRQTVLYPQRLLCIARQGHPASHGELSLEHFVSSQHARWGAPPVAHATMEAMVDEALEALGHRGR